MTPLSRSSWLVLALAALPLVACTSKIDSGVAADADPLAPDADPLAPDADPLAPDGGPDAAPPSCEASAEVTDVTFDVIPYANADLVAPGRGAEQWHDGYPINVPTQGTNTRPLDVYYRISWSQLEGAQGVYDWDRFDELINEAIDNGQKFSFGIITACPGCSDFNGPVPVGGAQATFPPYLHTLMQAEAVKDFLSGGQWIPNWNSEAYLSRYEALLLAIAAHLETGTHGGVAYKHAIGYIDVRGYGSWGEWHVAGIADTVAAQPAGTQATTATLKRLIDAHVTAFPKFPLVLLIAAFNADRYNNMGATTELGHYALTARNDFGPLGWRRDNWGDEDNEYIRYLLDLNPSSFGGDDLADLIMDRWKTSPIVGEPPGYTATADACEYDYLEEQVRRYHAVSFGNGNFVQTNQACMRDNIRAASKAAGYRLQLEGGSVSTTIRSDGAFNVSLAWHNVGLTPTYEAWDVVYELRDDGDAVVWSGASSFDPFRFLPAANATLHTDTLALPATVAPGTYDLVVSVRDPNGYRDPLPLAVQGRRADGGYLVKRVTVEACDE